MFHQCSRESFFFLFNSESLGNLSPRIDAFCTRSCALRFNYFVRSETICFQFYIWPELCLLNCYKISNFIRWRCLHFYIIHFSIFLLYFKNLCFSVSSQIISLSLELDFKLFLDQFLKPISTFVSHFSFI